MAIVWYSQESLCEWSSEKKKVDICQTLSLKPKENIGEKVYVQPNDCTFCPVYALESAAYMGHFLQEWHPM